MSKLNITQSRLEQLIKEEVIATLLYEAGIPFDERDYTKYDLYDILSAGGVTVTPDSDIQLLKKAFRKSSMTGDYRHPDLGGTVKPNSLLVRAYATLQSDKEGYDRVKFGPLYTLRRKIGITILKKYGDIFEKITVNENMWKELVSDLYTMGYNRKDIKAALNELAAAKINEHTKKYTQI